MSATGQNFFFCPAIIAPSVRGLTGLADYRAYTVGRDGHFIGYEPLVCDDDQQAIEQTKRLMNGYSIELWSGGRFVIKLPASP
jgi:hypothetical protein